MEASKRTDDHPKEIIVQKKKKKKHIKEFLQMHSLLVVQHTLCLHWSAGQRPVQEHAPLFSLNCPMHCAALQSSISRSGRNIHTFIGGEKVSPAHNFFTLTAFPNKIKFVSSLRLFSGHINMNGGSGVLIDNMLFRLCFAFFSFFYISLKQSQRVATYLRLTRSLR